MICAPRCASWPPHCLPTRQTDEGKVRGRIHLDWTGREASAGPTPHLRVLQRATWEDRCVHLTYRSQLGRYAITVDRTVEPYGLVARNGVWHVVYHFDGALHVLRADQVLAVTLLDAHFPRPPDFDLAAFWEAGAPDRRRTARPSSATVRVAPALAVLLPLYFGEALAAEIDRGSIRCRGWVTLTLPFERFEEARGAAPGTRQCGRGAGAPRTPAECDRLCPTDCRFL